MGQPAKNTAPEPAPWTRGGSSPLWMTAAPIFMRSSDLQAPLALDLSTPHLLGHRLQTFMSLARGDPQ